MTALSHLRRVAADKRIRDISVSAITLGLNIALVYASSAILANILGPEEFGLYSFIIATVTILTIPAYFGLPTLIAREVSSGVARGNLQLVKGLVKRSRQFVTVVSISVITLVLVSTTIGTLIAGWSPKPAYFWAIPLILVVSWAAITSASLRGVGKVVQSQWPDQILRPCLLLAIVVAVATIPGMGLSSAWAAAATVIAGCVALAVNLLQWRRSKPEGFDSIEPQFADRQWILTVIPMAMSAGILILNAQVGLVLIQLLSSTEEVGFFRVATQTAQLCALGYSAVIMNITPRLASASAHGDTKQMGQIALQGGLFAFLTCFPVAALMILFGKGLLSLMFSSAFGAAGLALAILAGGQVINTAFGCAAAILNMSGHERDCTKALFAGLAAQVVLCFLLIPAFGVTGAAVASVAGVLMSNVILWSMAKLRTGIDAGVWAWFSRHAKPRDPNAS